MSPPGAPRPFAGTARYYARFRPPYPQALLDHLRDRFGLDGSGRLLDLGCGTGHLAIPMAGWFREAVGMDPEPEMLAEAAAQARRAGVRNVTWIEGGSGDLPQLRNRLGRFALVTIGEAFHWMDRDATLRALAGMVDPGGGLAVIYGPGSLWSPKAPWQQALQGVIQRWLGPVRRAGSGVYEEPAERHEAVVARSAFRRMEIFRLPVTRSWTADQVVGWLYSTSFASPAVLGDRRPSFEADVRATLAALAPSGEFREDVVYEAILAWKEGGS